MSADLPDLWERQPRESEQAYYAFCLYRDQETPRGLPAVVSGCTDAGKPKSYALIKRWSAAWFWRDRARAWDRHQEEHVRRAQIKATKDMARRQARDAQAFQAVLIAPVEVLLRRLADPTRRQEIEQLSTGELVQLSVLTGRLFPRIALTERLARGAPIQDLTQFLDEDTGEITEGPSPRETYDWTREALAALEQATAGRLALPAGPEAPDA